MAARTHIETDAMDHVLAKACGAYGCPTVLEGASPNDLVIARMLSPIDRDGREHAAHLLPDFRPGRTARRRIEALLTFTE